MTLLTGRAPYKYDHDLIVGDTYQPCVLVVQDDDGAVIDLTGAVVTVQVCREPGGAVLLTPTGVILDAAAGSLTWSAPAEETAALTQGRARVGVRVTYATGEVRTLIDATVTIRRGVVG